MTPLFETLDAIARTATPEAWRALAGEMIRNFGVSAIRIESWNPWEVLSEDGKAATVERRRFRLTGVRMTVGQVLVWPSRGAEPDWAEIARTCRFVTPFIERSQEDREYGEVLSGALHDLRSPTRRLILFSQLSPESQEKEGLGDLTQYVAEDARSVELLFSMLGTWLNTRALDRDATASVADSLDQALYEASGDLTRRKVTIVRPSEASAEVNCPESALTHIFRQLIANSLNFCEDPLRIEVALESDGDDYLRIRFQDNGPGISEMDREQAFAAFRRLTGHPPGFGLGLALVRRAAMACGGWARAVEGSAGLTVEVGLPRACEEVQGSEVL